MEPLEVPVGHGAQDVCERGTERLGTVPISMELVLEWCWEAWRYLYPGRLRSSPGCFIRRNQAHQFNRTTRTWKEREYQISEHGPQNLWHRILATLSGLDSAGPRQRDLSVGYTGELLRLGGGVNMGLEEETKRRETRAANEYWTALRTDAQYYMDMGHLMFDRSVATGCLSMSSTPLPSSPTSRARLKLGAFRSQLWVVVAVNVSTHAE
ncbi:hypothetical protein INR49_024488 [Caranx melampygus]|nr:hypothetical protein INR49_024488 [Caranx melampygus]